MTLEKMSCQVMERHGHRRTFIFIGIWGMGIVRETKKAYFNIYLSSIHRRCDDDFRNL